LEGRNMSEKRQHFLREYDWIRKGLMFEPRGHDMMSGSILYPPHDPQNDVAVLFIETSGCLPMCGHGTIGTITIALEEGLIQPRQPGFVRMEAPAGLVLIEYKQEGGKVRLRVLLDRASVEVFGNGGAAMAARFTTARHTATTTANAVLYMAGSVIFRDVPLRTAVVQRLGVYRLKSPRR